MTEEFDDFERRLRAALRAEADDIPVSHDALERIRARTERRGLLPSWFELVWFRPVVAVGAAVLIAGSVLLGTPQIRDHVLPGSFVSASDTQRASESPPSPAHAPADRDGAVVPPTGDASPPPSPPLPGASPSAPESTDSPAESEQPACASADPGERDDAAEEDGDRSGARSCPSESPSAEPEPGASSPPVDDAPEEGASPTPGPPGSAETPSSPLPPPSGDDSTGQ